MSRDKELLQTFKRLTSLSNRTDLDHQEKFQYLLMEMIRLLNTEKGAIMTLSGRKYLQVRASTNPELIGIKQALTDETPSAWVFRNKKLLYVDRDNPFDCAAEKRDYKKEAFLLAPVILGKKVIGIISVTDRKGADRFDIQEQSLLLDFAGQIIGAIENYHLGETLEKKKKELQKKNRELKQLEGLRQELFNMLIHDLKGPLSNVVANLDILSYTTDNENLEYVTEAQAGCDTLFRMTCDLLDIARLEEGSLGLIHEKINVGDLLEEATARAHAVAKNRSISLLSEAPENSEKFVFSGDRGMLLRVLQNLIINAIHHSDRDTSVSVGFEPMEKSYIEFWIQDSGPGIAPEYQKAVFDKFFQVSKKNDGRVYSTGLGLTFCKMAVEAHGGNISVESNGKSGSKFKFSLPID